MLSSHGKRALDYRALAADCEAKAGLSGLGQVQARHVAAAARWEALATLEDLYVRMADVRREGLEPKARVSGALPG